MEFSCACGRGFESMRSLGCHKRYCAAASQKSPDINSQSCGKSFSEERKLRDHVKNNICGRKNRMSVLRKNFFETRSGVRQHEWKAHFQEYAAALTEGAKSDPAELLAAQLQALAEAELEMGLYPGRLAVRFGWTINMVRYRRRLTQYRALLDDRQDAGATISGDGPTPLLASPDLPPLPPLRHLGLILLPPTCCFRGPSALFRGSLSACHVVLGPCFLSVLRQRWPRSLRICLFPLVMDVNLDVSSAASVSGPLDGGLRSVGPPACRISSSPGLPHSQVADPSSAVPLPSRWGRLGASPWAGWTTAC
jgi:hypothetical protein